jgi:hypothetical protein
MSRTTPDLLWAWRGAVNGNFAIVTSLTYRCRPTGPWRRTARVECLWYAIQHPLGPSRELGSCQKHQKSAEKLVCDMNPRSPETE